MFVRSCSAHSDAEHVIIACENQALINMSTHHAQASLAEMIAPGALVILTPVVVGTLFGTRALAGLLAGSLVSGVQMAVSMSNTGGAWDNAKKYVEVRDLHRPHAHIVAI